MEIATVDKKNCIKIRGKKATLVVDPPKEKIPKVAADAILVVANKEFSVASVDEYRVVLQGSGEYEVGGVKITCVSAGEFLGYKMEIDELTVCVVPSNSLQSLSEKLNECDVLVVRVSGSFEESQVAAYAPKAVVLYGEAITADILKTFGKQDEAHVVRHTVVADKLPEEMQVVAL